MAKKSVRYKGHRFYESSALMLPVEHWKDGTYVNFGRVCGELAKGGVATDYKRDGYTVYAKPVKNLRHSRTNMARSDDGYEYLALDGRVYCRKWKTQFEEYNEKLEKRANQERELLETVCADAAKMIAKLEKLAQLQSRRGEGKYTRVTEARNALKTLKETYNL